MTVADIYESLVYGPAPEGRDPALHWIAEHEPFGLFIGGQWQEARSGERFEVVNPATGQPITSVAQASAEDVDAAVAAAREAFPAWSGLPCHVRARYLYA